MTNPLKGDVTFEAQGKTFTFKLGTNAQIMLEQKSGQSIVAWFQGREESFSKGDMRTLFHAGLFRQHQLTEEEVGDLRDEIGDEKVGQIFKQAAEFSQNKPKGNGAAEDDDARPSTPAKARIGMNS